MSTATENNSAGAPAAAVQEHLIVPARGLFSLNLGELWRYRELLGFLTWRDVKVRYKQTILGAAWALIQPVMMMVVFTVVFKRMADVPTGGIPYPVFVYAGLLPWTFFSTSITNAANSIVRSERLITKVYFPRLAIPIASIGAALVDLVIAFSVLAVLMAYYGIPVGSGFLLLVPLIAVAILAALGVGLVLAALNAAFRDFRYVVTYLVQLWLFATPAVYMDTTIAAERDQVAVTDVSDATAPDAASKAESEAAVESADGEEQPSRIPEFVRPLLNLNPMTGVILGFRAAILNKPLPMNELGMSGGVILVTFIVGLLYFRRVEDSLADIV